MKKLLFNPIIIIIVSIISLYFIFSLRKNLQKINLSRQNMTNIKQQVDNLEEEMLFKQVELEKARKSYSKEKILRDELLLKKPGEFVIQLPELVIENKVEEQIDNKTPINEWQELIF